MADEEAGRRMARRALRADAERHESHRATGRSQQHAVGLTIARLTMYHRTIAAKVIACGPSRIARRWSEVAERTFADEVPACCSRAGGGG